MRGARCEGAGRDDESYLDGALRIPGRFRKLRPSAVGVFHRRRLDNCAQAQLDYGSGGAGVPMTREDVVHFKPIWPLQKRAARGFRGYPVATVSFYGPDDRRATKVAVGIVRREGAEADQLERWLSADGDVRADEQIARQISDFIDAQGAKSVALRESIFGCPHQEGIDYPEGESCPQCPFWANRDRWTGQLSG